MKIRKDKFKRDKKDKKEKKKKLKCNFCHKQGHIQEKYFRYLAELQSKTTCADKQQTAKIATQASQNSDDKSSKFDDNVGLFCFKINVSD